MRPNLGVIFAPSLAGLGYKIQDGQMPWPGEPLSQAAIRASRGIAVAEAKTMRLAAEFYRIHRERGPAEVVAYHADTQGVFDIAHLLYGEDIFYDLADPAGADWIEELLGISLDLYIATTRQLRQLLSDVQRLAALVRSTGARCILRPVVFPSDRSECAAMRELWHELTK